MPCATSPGEGHPAGARLYTQPSRRHRRRRFHRADPARGADLRLAERPRSGLSQGGGRRAHRSQHHAGLGSPHERADCLREAAARRHRRGSLHPRSGRSREGRHEDGQRTNSRRAPPFPGTRGKSASLVRQKFVGGPRIPRESAPRGRRSVEDAAAGSRSRSHGGGPRGPPDRPPFTRIDTTTS